MKNFNSRVVSLVIALLFILNSTVYGIDLSDKTKTHLRVQLTGSTQEGQKRQIEALAETYHEHVNAYIEPQARARYEAFLKGREDTPENRVAFYNNLPTYNGIAVMEIVGLYDNTALLDHGGQGQFYGGRQIIYLEKGLTQEEKDYILAHVHGEGLMWRVQMTKDGFAGRPAEWRSHLIADYGHYQDLERQFDEDAPEVPEEILAKYRRIAEGTGLLEMIAELPRKDVVIAAGGKLSRRGFVKGLGGVLGALALTPKKILIDALGESATDARQGATGEVLADLNRVPEDGESPVVPAQNWGPVTSPNGEFKAYAFSTYPENPYDIWLVIEDVATGSELSRTKIGNQIRGDGVYSIQWTTDSEHVVLETSLRFAYPLSTERSGVLVVTPGGNVIVNVDAYQDGKPIINTELIFTDTDLALTYKKAIYHGPPYPGGDPYYTYEGPYTEVFRFTLGAENASFVFAGHAYVRQGYNLVVTDVNTGEVVSVYDTGYTIYGLRSQGDNYLYVLNAQEEIEIVDISDPNNLQRVGAITIPESERLIMYDDFILDGDVAYGTRFVDAEGGPGMYIGDLYLDIYDLTDPTQPQLVSEYHIGSFDNRPKYGRGFISKVDENHVVVDVSRNGIRILDISNPDAIAQV